MTAVIGVSHPRREPRIGSLILLFTVQAFFVGMLVLPTAFQRQRGVILALIAAVAVIAALRHWRVHRDVLLLWLSTMVVGTTSTAWGVANDAPGALRVSTVFLIWPALYMLFIGLAHGLTVMRRLVSALMLGIVLATAMALAVFASGLLGLGDIVLPLLAFQDVGFGAYDGFTEFRISNLTTVMYGFPFVVAFLFANRHQRGRWRKGALWLLVAIMGALGVGSGRRMFWLLILLTPFFTLFFLQISALRLKGGTMLLTLGKLGILAATAVVGLAIAIDLQPVILAGKFFDAFAGVEASSGVRFQQALALWEDFARSPLLGSGLGSVVDESREKLVPWSYELWYLSLLKSVGLLGIVVYAVAVGWVVVKGMLLARRSRDFAALFVPSVTAMAGFLIMNATNPYLGKFDYLWVIFLPVALINAHLTERERAKYA